MSDDFEPDITEQSNIASLSHSRILWTMAIITVLGGFAGLIFVSLQFGLGVFFGGILSFVNYYWLKISLRKIFDSVTYGERPRFLAIRYFARYATLALILTIVFLTKIVPVVAVVLGLLTLALAIMIEGFLRIFSTFFKNKEF